MADKLTQKNRELAIQTPLGEDALLLTSMSGKEKLGQPFEFKLELASESDKIKAEDIIGQNVTIRLTLTNEKSRYFNGLVNRFIHIPPSGRLARYRATIVPRLWFLTRTADCRIFQDKPVPDIIETVFKKYGLAIENKGLSGSYSTREYCVQYRETDFDFVSRLMEQEGIYFYFEHENGRHTLVLADSAGAHEACPDNAQIKYHLAKAVGDRIWDWNVETRVQPDSYALNDFDFKNTQKDLQARQKASRKYTAADFEIFEIYDYPGKYTEASDGEGYARRRIEELQAQYEVVTASSNVRGICTGSTFTLTGHPRDDQNREYLITSAQYEIDAGEFFSTAEGARAFAYSCSFSAIDAGQMFRSPRATPKPTIHGPQTAIVVGQSGEEVFTDEYGRVKVKFHWDRYSKANENSSCWIRVAQVWAGKKWGAMYIPRIGQEVIVEFLEGDPDRPIITGRVYNAQAMPPYDPKTNKTTSTIKSNSSKGGQGFNEIRFEDKKGEEQIYVHAEKDEDARVENDVKEWVGQDRHLIVKRDQLEEVGGDKHLTVKGDQNEKIDGTVSLNAGMDLQQKVGMKHALEAGMDIHIKGGMKVVIEAGMQLSLKAGASFIDIGPGGVAISGTPAVMINSGGSAGTGSGASPDAAKLPEEAATGEPGKVSELSRSQSSPSGQPAPPPGKPAPAGKSSPQAATLQQAAKDGTPFCEECEKAKQQSG